MSIEVTPLSPALGAEISGVDLGRPIDAAEFRAIHAAWLAHQVLVFRGQSVAEAAQVQFSTLFGDLPERSRFRKRTDAPSRTHESIMLITNIREDGQTIGSLPDGEMMFHTDGAYDEHPYRYTFLHAIEVPSHGGNTLFANMYRAYDDLSPAMKDRLADLHAVHSYYGGRDVPQAMKDALEIGDFMREQAHPIFTAHEETGRPVLYVSRLLTNRILELSEAESDALLAELFDHTERDEAIYEHRWRVGDVVMWDNRCVNHTRRDFPADERRLLRRTTVQGVRPGPARQASNS